MESDRSMKAYDDLHIGLCKKDLSGQLLSPNLVLRCKTVETARILMAGLPAVVKSLLAGEAEMYEFSNDEAAVKFPLKSGEDIMKLFGLLGEGNYSGPLRITGGMAIRLPKPERQVLRQFVNTQNLFGIGRSLEEEDFWWW